MSANQIRRMFTRLRSNSAIVAKRHRDGARRLRAFN